MTRALLIVVTLVAAAVGCVRSIDLDPVPPDASNLGPDSAPIPDGGFPVPDASGIDAAAGLPDADLTPDAT